MPGVVQYVEPNDRSREALFVHNPERRARSEAYAQAKSYYLGAQRKYLDVKPGEPDDNVTLNNTRVSIDRTLSLLFPAMPRLELNPLDPEPTPEETWLEDFWAANKGIFRLTEIAQNGAFSGQCYVRVAPPLPGGMYPRVINLNPTNVVTFWKGDDMEDILWHEHYWTSGGTNGTGGAAEYLNDFIRDPRTGMWRIVSYERAPGGAWNQVAEEDWRSVWGPIITWPHMPVANEFYGLSETANLHLDDKLNLITSEAARITRYHGSPKTVALGIEASDIKETSIDGLWSTATPKTEADIYNLEFRALASDFVENLMTEIRDAKMQENRVVVLRGDIADFQRVTNAGIRTVFLDMLAKNALLRESYGSAIQSISMSAAYVAGKRLNRKPDILWPDPLPSDDAELIKTLETEMAMGLISKTSAAAKRGLNWREEAEQIENENARIAPAPVKLVPPAVQTEPTQNA